MRRMRLSKPRIVTLSGVAVFFLMLYYIRVSDQKVTELEHRIKDFKRNSSRNSDTVHLLYKHVKFLSDELKSIDRSNFESKERILALLNDKFNAQERVLSLVNITMKKYLKKDDVTTGTKAESGGLCDDPEAGNKRVISYSIFGQKAEYLSRFIKDVHTEAQGIFPYNTFTLRIYFGETLSHATRNKLRKSLPNVRFCDIRKVPQFGDLSAHIGTVWRFIPLADKSLDVFCVRDLDSPLLQRGGDAVNEWLGTDNIMHVMRDRSQHGIPIMGGMWCFRPSASDSMGKDFLEKILSESGEKGLSTRDDQTLINKIIWPNIKSRTLQHDAYFCKTYKDAKPFPTERREYYVGCVRDCWVYKKEVCPVECRPPKHQDWIYC